MKGHVYQRGSSWYYKFPSPEVNEKGKHPSITKGGFKTEKEAWTACRDAIAETERGRYVKRSRRTVAGFINEWLPAIKMSVDATTWDNWSTLCRAYVKPRIGSGVLQDLSAPGLMKFYGELLSAGRIKPDTNTVMYRYWSQQVKRGRDPVPRDMVSACGVSIHAARAAIRRYKAGRIPVPQSKGLQPVSRQVIPPGEG